MQRPLTMQSTYPAAPELAITRWFNTADNPTLEDLRGEVVVIEASRCSVPAASPTGCLRPSASSKPSATTSPCSVSTACSNTTTQ